MPKLALALCEGEHDKCMIEDILRRKLFISKILNARDEREIHNFIRGKMGEFIVYDTGGKENLYKALNDLSSQFLRLRPRGLDSICVVIDENQEKPIDKIENRLRSYLFDISKFPSERPGMSRDESDFMLSYRGFDLRVLVAVVPGSLETQVEAALGHRDVDYCELDYLSLFESKSWFRKIIEALESIIRS